MQEMQVYVKTLHENLKRESHKIQDVEKAGKGLDLIPEWPEMMR